MIREDRYLVIKKEDLDYLDIEEQFLLNTFLFKIKERRNKPETKYVVVGSDWPEYETVWKSIEERVDSENTIHS